MTLTEVGIWITVGFVSGSVPWSLILTSTISGKDARRIGDGNPGATNAWIMAGWRVGVPSMAFDVCKSAIPVWLALGSLEYSNNVGDHFLIATIAISPIIGHAWSPLLRFKRGKALDPSWGS
ncbi:MAG: glycerol-3-phosphate acyltransferase, partial [Chloroflexota bacterium]|nr:glycerol-3-phosphate acyltransferase [Chloroflexota bacterium]